MSSKVKSKADLMMKIKQVRMLLNGRYRDGSKASFASDFKITRYAVVLLAAISISNFEYHTEKIQNGTFISYYNLYKVARFLGIEFERTKSAPYVYKKLIEKDQIKLVVESNRTFITFTEKGRKSCEEKLDELQHLDREFNLNPFEQQKYRESIDRVEGISKGGKSRPLVGIETQVDVLIKKISQW